MKPDVAFYYPGQHWYDADWIKNLVLFFDGIAMLIPKHMEDHGTFDDYPIISSLKEHALFHVIRPEEKIGAEETKELAEALLEIIVSGRLDHLTKESRRDAKHSSFGSLSMSRLGYYGDVELADFIFQELKARGLADDSADGVTIPMHRTGKSVIVVRRLAAYTRLQDAVCHWASVGIKHDAISKNKYATLRARGQP